MAVVSLIIKLKFFKNNMIIAENTTSVVVNKS